ncbi:type II toxin-antitoxin system mRNA interferase toxin, RelE/StbE family [Laspinema sp. D1]|uniref:type II toxin-antitoxin system RelE/ParE family toxin n=1 Tax=Laspinema palackyanum TaxID=3231601 RepID=UPI00347E4100|nr:type II toxin-antitoxin system mRNA interferase toxin, RelE/StbE family [Laspinema sp. D2b]
MRNLVWTPSFVRGFKRLIRRNPQLKTQIQQTLEQLSTEPFYPSLRTHKLKGDLEEFWACSIDYSHRIIFRFVSNPETELEEIFLVSLGSHDEVY